MIDFSKLTMMVGPRFRQTKAQRDDREKLARSHMRRAKGHKNHSTNKERSQHERARAKAVKKLIAQREAELSSYRQAVKAYWAGDAEEHPR